MAAATARSASQQLGAVLLLLLIGSHCVVLAVRDTKYYKLLGVEPGADDKEIKKAYRKLAM